MRSLVLILILTISNLLQADDFVSVCDRTPGVREGIRSQVAALSWRPEFIPDCSKITAADLEKVNYLILGEAGLTQITSSDFQGLNNLEDLILSGNKLRDLDPGVFSHLKKLKILSLHNNQFTLINPKALAGLIHLTTISLSHNPLIRIDVNIFGETPSLKFIALANTRIQKFPPGICSKSPHLVSIRLLENRLLHEISDFAFADCNPNLEVDVFGSPLTLTRKAAFHGLINTRELPADFDQDGEDWGGQ